MTVGIAAIAQSGRAIVLCADRQQTGQDDTRHRGVIAKKRAIGYGWHFLLEDNATRADRLRDDVRALLKKKYGGRSGALTDNEMVDTVQEAFRQLRSRTVVGRKKFDLGILLVGFDENNEAVGYSYDQKGEPQSIRHAGYGAIGSGYYMAESVFAHYDSVAADDHPTLDHVLYKVWEAKRRADEYVPSVGQVATDLWVITDQAKLQADPEPKAYPPEVVVAPDWIKKVLEEMYEWVGSAPWRRKAEPIVWGSTLARYAQDVLDGKNPL